MTAVELSSWAVVGEVPLGSGWFAASWVSWGASGAPSSGWLPGTFVWPLVLLPQHWMLPVVGCPQVKPDPAVMAL